MQITNVYIYYTSIVGRQLTPRFSIEQNNICLDDLYCVCLIP